MWEYKVKKILLTETIKVTQVQARHDGRKRMKDPLISDIMKAKRNQVLKF